MPEREKVINHLQIIHTWAAVDKKYDGIDPKCCENIEEWTMDAISLLEEQEDKCNSCILHKLISEAVHDMAKEFRKQEDDGK